MHSKTWEDCDLPCDSSPHLDIITVEDEIAQIKLPAKLCAKFNYAPYDKGVFGFDLGNRNRANEQHRSLLKTISEENAKAKEKCHLKCACQPNRPTLVVKRRGENFFICLKAKSGLQHAVSCPFRAQTFTTYSVDAIRPIDGGTVAISLDFTLGAPAKKKGQDYDERVLRLRKSPTVRFNAVGPMGLLRLLIHEARLNFWCPAFDRKKHRSEDKNDGSLDWKQTRVRISRALDRIFWNKQSIAQHCRLMHLLDDLKPGFTYFVVDAIREICPHLSDGWYILLCRMPYTRLYLSKETLRSLLALAGYKSDTIVGLLSARDRIVAREGEHWWAGLVVEFTQSKGHWVHQAAMLRTDCRAIPIESEPELRMIEHLIAGGWSFTKPLFPGCLEKLPNRRPDFMLSDVAIPDFCIEVAGMTDFEEYEKRDAARRNEYDSAGIQCVVWTPPEALPNLQDAVRLD